jgi:hypothetical protein
MTDVKQACIQVTRLGRHRYAATVIARPELDDDSPFQMPLMEQGPYIGRRHRSAWRKAWNDVGRPEIVELDEL